MNKTYISLFPSRGWIRLAAALALAAAGSASHAQQGSSGNTTIFGGAQMTFFGDHNFATGGGGTQPGVINTIRTSPMGVLNFGPAANTVTGADDGNYVDGYVRKLGNTPFIFPVGDNSHYGPFAASADGTTGAYFFTDPNSAVTSMLPAGNYPALPAGGPFATTSRGAGVNTVSTVEYWDIDGTNATPLTLTWDAASAIGTLTSSDLSKLTIVGWNGTRWIAIPSAVNGTSVLGGASDFSAGSITTSASLSPDTFIAYTFASTKPVVPPTATNDNATASGSPVEINILTNDTPGSEPFVLSRLRLIDPNTSQPETSVTIPGEGTYTVDTSTGIVTFDPDDSFTGSSTITYSVEDQTGTTVTAQITVTVSPLPVTLVSFTAFSENQIARLTWSTTMETNSDRFEVEHSLTGSQWNRIGTVLSHGESTSKKDYTFTHTDPAATENLYRLKMIDKDGSYAYSRIQSIRFEKTIELSVYPNPASERLLIKNYDQLQSVVIYSTAGRKVIEQKQISAQGIDVSRLPAGIYLVTLTLPGGTQSTHKIAVAR